MIMRLGYLKQSCVVLILMLVVPAGLAGQNLKLGEPAPDFTVPSLDGKRMIRLSDFRGRRVLVFTWASW